MRRTDQAPDPFPIRVVIDSNVFLHTKAWMKPLETLAHDGYIRLFWSPWIISEVNRVLTWHWLRRNGNDASNQAWKRCSEQAKAMFSHTTRMFEVIDDRPPYPATWEEPSADAWDIPIFAAARRSKSTVLVTENLTDAPPLIRGVQEWDGIAYLHPTVFLDFVTWLIDEVGSSNLESIDDDGPTYMPVTRSPMDSGSDSVVGLLHRFVSDSQPDPK